VEALLQIYSMLVTWLIPGPYPRVAFGSNAPKSFDVSKILLRPKKLF